MEKILAAADGFAGLLAFSLGISGLAVYSNWTPDNVAVGIWGGIYLLAFAALLFMKMLKKSQIVMGMAVLAALIGATMIGIHSWSIDMYQPLIADCKMYDSINSTLPNSTVTIGEEYPDIFEPVKICDRTVIDSLMLVCGILAVVVNGFIAATASSIASD
ncbi:hypothetical protein DAPPUDRAFT_302561 [Daphnia pulex]|uniref:Uncharacterized protein n=1 Tax=Daphnia pulex TaxID=6669 RepID=E9GEA0_DAPPU|nr:hypothetical protein DAPPUDRAFT_302561 [Daphnia pulex]|eukprot:EFX82348.1 hypothetical protein DAPPUDRAFT_302561 [Daphnia pulex]